MAPSELEDLIRRHPGVLDVAVVGVPDERVLSLFILFYFIRGRYDNPIPTWFLALIDCSKIPAWCLKCTPNSKRSF